MEISFKKYLLTAVIGFGIGGMLWGWEAFRGTVGAGETITNPFSYILGAVFLGILGSTALAIFSKNIKEIIKVIILGTLGWIIGFLLPVILSYWWWLFGGIITFVPEFFIESGNIEKFIRLSPSLDITYFWLEFLITGAIIGLFFALIFKAKIWPIVWRGGIGFGLGSLVGPIIGNLIGNLFGSLLVSYFLTFTTIGIILGLFLAQGIYRNQKRNNIKRSDLK